MVNFTAHMDASTWRRTLSVGCLFLLLPISSWSSGHPASLWMIVPALVLLLGFGYGYLLMPKTYRFDTQTLVITRYIGSIRIPLSTIRSVHSIRHDLLEHQPGGAFGYSGKRQTWLGTIACYTSGKKNLVLITLTSGSQLLLNPNNPESFVAALESMLQSDICRRQPAKVC